MLSNQRQPLAPLEEASRSPLIQTNPKTLSKIEKGKEKEIKLREVIKGEEPSDETNKEEVVKKIISKDSKRGINVATKGKNEVSRTQEKVSSAAPQPQSQSSSSSVSSSLSPASSTTRTPNNHLKKKPVSQSPEGISGKNKLPPHHNFTKLKNQHKTKDTKTPVPSPLSSKSSNQESRKPSVLKKSPLVTTNSTKSPSNIKGNPSTERKLYQSRSNSQVTLKPKNSHEKTSSSSPGGNLTMKQNVENQNEAEMKFDSFSFISPPDRKQQKKGKQNEGTTKGNNRDLTTLLKSNSGDGSPLTQTTSTSGSNLRPEKDADTKSKNNADQFERNDSESYLKTLSTRKHLLTTPQTPFSPEARQAMARRLNPSSLKSKGKSTFLAKESSPYKETKNKDRRSTILVGNNNQSMNSTNTNSTTNNKNITPCKSTTDTITVRKGSSTPLIEVFDDLATPDDGGGFCVDIEDIEIIKPIAEGAYGLVSEAIYYDRSKNGFQFEEDANDEKWNDEDESQQDELRKVIFKKSSKENRTQARKVAVKLQPVPSIDYEQVNLLAELSVLKSLSHPRLVKYIGAAIVEEESRKKLFSRYGHKKNFNKMKEREQRSESSYSNISVSNSQNGHDPHNTNDIKKGGGKTFDDEEDGDASLLELQHTSKIMTVEGEYKEERNMKNNDKISKKNERESFYPQIMIVMELYQYGALREAIILHLPWVLRMSLAQDIAEGLNFLHQKNIIHRDLKTTNILLDNNLRAVICDHSFAISSLSPDLYAFTCGTLEFMSPEMATNKPYDTSTDIFGLGIILCELITEKEPGRDGFLVRSPKDDFDLDFESQVEEFVGPGCPPSLLVLAKQCCDSERDLRPDALTAMEWLGDIVEEQLETKKSKSPNKTFTQCQNAYNETNQKVYSGPETSPKLYTTTSDDTHNLSLLTNSEDKSILPENEINLIKKHLLEIQEQHHRITQEQLLSEGRFLSFLTINEDQYKNRFTNSNSPYRLRRSREESKEEDEESQTNHESETYIPKNNAKEKGAPKHDSRQLNNHNTKQSNHFSIGEKDRRKSDPLLNSYKHINEINGKQAFASNSPNSSRVGQLFRSPQTQKREGNITMSPTPPSKQKIVCSTCGKSTSILSSGKLPDNNLNLIGAMGGISHNQSQQNKKGRNYTNHNNAFNRKPNPAFRASLSPRHSRSQRERDNEDIHKRKNLPSNLNVNTPRQAHYHSTSPCVTPVSSQLYHLKLNNRAESKEGSRSQPNTNTEALTEPRDEQGKGNIKQENKSEFSLSSESLSRDLNFSSASREAKNNNDDNDEKTSDHEIETESLSRTLRTSLSSSSSISEDQNGHQNRSNTFQKGQKAEKENQNYKILQNTLNLILERQIMTDTSIRELKVAVSEVQKEVTYCAATMRKLEENFNALNFPLNMNEENQHMVQEERPPGAEKKEPKQQFTPLGMKNVLHEIKEQFLPLKSSVGQLEKQLSFSTKVQNQNVPNSDSTLISASSDQEDSILSVSTSAQTTDVIAPESVEKNV